MSSVLTFGSQADVQVRRLPRPDQDRLGELAELRVQLLDGQRQGEIDCECDEIDFVRLIWI